MTSLSFARSLSLARARTRSLSLLLSLLHSLLLSLSLSLSPFLLTSPILTLPLAQSLLALLFLHPTCVSMRVAQDGRWHKRRSVSCRLRTQLEGLQDWSFLCTSLENMEMWAGAAEEGGGGGWGGGKGGE